MRLYGFHKFGLQNREILELLNKENLRVVFQEGNEARQPKPKPPPAAWSEDEEETVVPGAPSTRTAEMEGELTTAEVCPPKYTQPCSQKYTMMGEQPQPRMPVVSTDKHPPHDDKEGPSDMSRVNMKPKIPQNPMGVELCHVTPKPEKAKTCITIPQKRTLSQLIEEMQPNKTCCMGNQQDTKQTKATTMQNWEVMGTTLTYRTAAITMKSHKHRQQQEGVPETIQSENDEEHWMTQSTDPTSAHTQSDHILGDQPDLQQICPIAQLQSSQEEIPPEPI